MKRPSFQFYPADWRKDNELRSCSSAARGLWIEMMILAHECVPYGHLALNGIPMDSDAIARLTAISGDECAALLSELEVRGVFSRGKNGTIYSRRMVKDEAIRNARAIGGEKGAKYGQKGAEHGKKGGRPKIDTGVLKPPLYPPPSSSTSSADINNKFDDFWISYPRKESRAAALLEFGSAAQSVDPSIIVAASSAYAKASKINGVESKFLLGPVRWLQEQRWQDYPESDPAVIATSMDRADKLMRRGKYADQ